MKRQLPNGTYKDLGAGHGSPRGVLIGTSGGRRAMKLTADEQAELPPKRRRRGWH